MKIRVFDFDRLPRRVLDRSWPILAAKSAKNDPNLAPQDDPKSTKNRCQKTIEILIENKTNFERLLGRSGGMRWPPGGIIGGSKNYPAGLKFCILKICRFKIGILCFKIWRFGIWIGHLAVYLTRCNRPYGAGGGFNRFAHSAGPISRVDSAVAFGIENSW